MKNMMDQNTDSMNKVTASITALQGSLEKLQNDNGAKVDQLSGQIQALNDSLDELKARLAKVSKQLEDMQAAQQSVAAGQAAQQAQQQAWRRLRLRMCCITTRCGITTRRRMIWRNRSLGIM